MGATVGLVEKVKSSVNRGRAKLTPEQFRKAKPVRNNLVRWEENEDGSVLIIAPIDVDRRAWLKWMAKYMKMPVEKQFELEPIGGFVWIHCDGQQTSETIARKLRERFKMNRLEAEASLSAFLSSLTERRLITLLIGKSK